MIEVNRAMPPNADREPNWSDEVLISVRADDVVQAELEAAIEVSMSIGKCQMSCRSMGIKHVGRSAERK